MKAEGRPREEKQLARSGGTCMAVHMVMMSLKEIIFLKLNPHVCWIYIFLSWNTGHLGSLLESMEAVGDVYWKSNMNFEKRLK